MLKMYMKKALMIEEILKVIEAGKRFRLRSQELTAKCLKLKDELKVQLTNNTLEEYKQTNLGEDFEYWENTINMYKKTDLMNIYSWVLDAAVKFSELNTKLTGILVLDMYKTMEKGKDIEVTDSELLKLKSYAWAWAQRDIYVIGTTGKGTNVVILQPSKEEIDTVLRDLELTGVAISRQYRNVFMYLKVKGYEDIRVYHGLITWTDKKYYEEYEEAKNMLKKAMADTVGYNNPIILGDYRVEWYGVLDVTYIGKNPGLENIPLTPAEMKAMTKELLTEYDEISPNFEHMNHVTRGYILSCKETVESYFKNNVYWAKSGTPEAEKLQKILENAGI